MRTLLLVVLFALGLATVAGCSSSQSPPPDEGPPLENSDASKKVGKTDRVPPPIK